MDKIEIVDITFKKEKFRKSILRFLNDLDEEKKYFNLDYERFGKFRLTLAGIRNDEICGLAGLETKYGIYRSLISIKKEYQGQRLGEHLLISLLEEAKKNHSIVLAVIDEQNVIAQNLHTRLRYRIVGKRDNLVYAFRSFNRNGRLFYELIRFLFPLTILVDKIRKWNLR